MLLSHSSKKCCIAADINYLGKAGKPFPTGTQMYFIIWFSHWGRLNTPVTAGVLLMVMWPNWEMCKPSLNCQCQRQREQSQLLGRLGAVAFPPGKVHTESSKNKQEFKAEKGCRAESVLSSLQSSSPWGIVQLFCWATSGEHRAPTAHCASEVNLRAFSKTCDLWVQAIDQKKNVVITCVGEIGKGQGTIRNNLYDWFSRFNTLLCYSLRNPFQTCRKKPISNAKLLFRLAEKGQSLMPNQWLCRERSLVCCHCATTYIWWCALRIYHLLIFATPSSLIPCKEGQTEACLFWSQNIYH